MACLDDLLWCNVDEDLSVNIRGWFGSCGGWTLLLRLLVCLFSVVREHGRDGNLHQSQQDFSPGSLIYLVFPSGAFLLPYSAVFCTTQALPTCRSFLLLAGCVVGS